VGRGAATVLVLLTAIALPASAGARSRYAASVRVEGQGHGPQPVTTFDDLVFLFRDRLSLRNPRYRLCVVRSDGQRRVCRRSRRRRLALRSAGHVPGRYIARWHVRGRVVRTRRFDVAAVVE
jgi:hypothetical protein